MQTGPIIVGVDGSEASSAALAWAVDHAEDGQTIHVVHAFSPVAELALAAVQQDWTEQRQHRARELDKTWVASAHARGAAPYTSIVDDDPAGALMSKVETCGGSMIVVGPHGSGGRASMGRVARALVHDLPVPVAIARPTPVTDSGERRSRVLAAIGYGHSVDTTIDWAAAFASGRGFALELFHVVGYRPLVPLDSPSDMLASYLGGSVPVDWAASELEERAEAIRDRYPGLDVSTRVERGSVIRRTVDRSASSSLVVLGQSHVERATRNLYASRTLGIVSQAACTVVVVPA